MSFADRIKTSKGVLLYLVRATDQGKAAWYYVLVDKVKLPVFLAKIKAKEKAMPLKEYGEIIERGWGENPSEAAIARIKATYGE